MLEAGAGLSSLTTTKIVTQTQTRMNKSLKIGIKWARNDYGGDSLVGSSVVFTDVASVGANPTHAESTTARRTPII